MKHAFSFLNLGHFPLFTACFRYVHISLISFLFPCAGHETLWARLPVTSEKMSAGSKRVCARMPSLASSFPRPGKPSVLSGGAHAVAEHCPHNIAFEASVAGPLQQWHGQCGKMMGDLQQGMGAAPHCSLRFNFGLRLVEHIVSTAHKQAR